MSNVAPLVRPSNGQSRLTRQKRPLDPLRDSKERSRAKPRKVKRAEYNRRKLSEAGHENKKTLTLGLNLLSPGEPTPVTVTITTSGSATNIVWWLATRRLGVAQQLDWFKPRLLVASGGSENRVDVVALL